MIPGLINPGIAIIMFLRIINYLRKKEKKSVCDVFLCLHALVSWFLLLSDDNSGLWMIKNISSVQILHILLHVE